MSREEPKLCPDPGPENINGRKLFDVQYEQYVRSIVNPQRQPPLPAGLAFSLTDPEDVREKDFISDNIDRLGQTGHETD